jgi:FixJ family two-component response regulator/signal transduction histidine kinase
LAKPRRIAALPSPQRRPHPWAAPASAFGAARELWRFERLLAELSARFINLPAAEVDDAITDALRQIVGIIGAERSQLIRFPPQGDEAHVTHSWAVEGVPAVPPKSLASAYPWLIRCIRAGRAVVLPRLDHLPPAAAVDRASFRRAGVRSNLTMPMRVAGRIEGCIALGCLRHERNWPEDLVERVRVLATVFGNALAHKRAQESLDAAMAFERTVTAVLAALLTTGRPEQDQVIESGLREMARVFGAERATLWQRVGDRVEFVKMHRWVADGVPTPPDSVGAATTPWVSAQLVRGAPVCFARHADLPPEAAADLPGLRALGIRAGVAVPLVVSGAVVGALAFATTRADREWPNPLLPRVQLVGEVFAGTLARQAAERREQDAQAQAAHAARVGTMGVIAASLVHELTQPLAASLANAQTAAELLAAPSFDLDELRATVADIVADDRRVGDLIQQLRRFLRRGEVERTELDLREVVGEALRLAGSEAADKGVALSLDIPDDLPKLSADRVQLQQVLLNLLLNAVDAVGASAPQARRVAVLARRSGAGVSVEVTDSGHGMDERTLARVFQPFFTTKPRGMGLGLAISRSIVAAHGGSLAARSAPGRGTTFRLELPLRPPEEVRPPPPAVATSGGAGTVFVIDDDPSMRRALDRQLAGAGYRVEMFASAQDYLDRAPQARSACIVSDVRMPGLSGLDLQASLARAGRDLPMVFISGHGDVPTTVSAMKAGAVGFLAKPFSKGELLAAVAEALAQGRELAAAREAQADLQRCYGALTPRECEVLALVAAGLLNKVAAERLGIAEKTIKIHRGRVMEKMGAASVADLVRMAERLGLQRAAEPARG